MAKGHPDKRLKHPDLCCGCSRLAAGTTGQVSDSHSSVSRNSCDTLLISLCTYRFAFPWLPPPVSGNHTHELYMTEDMLSSGAVKKLKNPRDLNLSAFEPLLSSLIHVRLQPDHLFATYVQWLKNKHKPHQLESNAGFLIVRVETRCGEWLSLNGVWLDRSSKHGETNACTSHVRRLLETKQEIRSKWQNKKSAKILNVTVSFYKHLFLLFPFVLPQLSCSDSHKRKCIRVENI